MVWAVKIVSTGVVLAGLLAGLFARPPARTAPARELIGLGLAVVLLYGAGEVALVAHRTALAALPVGSGLLLCGLALWLSRGERRPPDDAGDEDPPPPPPPAFDWDFYESELARTRVRSNSH